MKRWSATRRKNGLARMGVDEIYFGKQRKFITVVSNLETANRYGLDQTASKKLSINFFQTDTGGPVTYCIDALGEACEENVLRSVSYWRAGFLARFQIISILS